MHKMIKYNIKCDNCGTDFYMRPSRIARTKFIYCCKECRLKHQDRRNVTKLEEKLGIYNLKDYLYTKYIEELKTSREIAILLYDNENNNDCVCVLLKFLNIPIRHGSEAIKTQFTGDKFAIRSQLSRNNANTFLQTKVARDNLRVAMQTDEFKSKISKANSGALNGMYGVRGKENPLWNPNKTRLQRQKDRKLFENREWRNKVFERDNYTCKITGIRGGKLVAHHLDGYCLNIEERFKIDNGITISESVHKLFHHNYGSGKNTIKQFEEFKQNYNLTSAN